MGIEVRRLSLNYKSQEVDKARLSYRVSGRNSFNGSVELSKEQYEGNETTEKLEGLAKNHFKEKIEDLEFEIRNINMTYKGKEVDKVQAVLQARSDNELSGNGSLELSKKEYDENSSPDQLESLFKERLLSEIEAE
jgi:hypothetical protein